MSTESSDGFSRPHLEVAEVEFRLGRELSTAESAEELVARIADAFELELLAVQTYCFEPQGLTCVGIVGESHISLHTWPEHSYGHIEILSCRELPSPATINDRIAAIGCDVHSATKRDGYRRQAEVETR